MIISCGYWEKLLKWYLGCLVAWKLVGNYLGKKKKNQTCCKTREKYPFVAYIMSILTLVEAN